MAIVRREIEERLECDRGKLRKDDEAGGRRREENRAGANRGGQRRHHHSADPLVARWQSVAQAGRKLPPRGIPRWPQDGARRPRSSSVIARHPQSQAAKPHAKDLVLVRPCAGNP